MSPSNPGIARVFRNIGLAQKGRKAAVRATLESPSTFALVPAGYAADQIGNKSRRQRGCLERIFRLHGQPEKS